jgi:hypothetical protein
MLALHYQCFGAPLPPTGAIWRFSYSNVDFMAGRFPDQIIELTKNTAIPARERTLLGDQFLIKWNVVPNTHTGVFLCELQGRLAICGITTDTPEKLVSAWKQKPMRPYDHSYNDGS